MENNAEMLELLKQIEKSTRQQARSSKIQSGLLLITALCCGVVLVAVLGLLPQVNGLMTQMETVLTNLEQTSSQLSAIDLQGMVDNMDALVVTGQQGLEQTMEKLNSVDFEALNRAIKDLADVIESLAKVFNLFK